jgi:hypothetical protein
MKRSEISVDIKVYAILRIGSRGGSLQSTDVTSSKNPNQIDNTLFHFISYSLFAAKVKQKATTSELH